MRSAPSTFLTAVVSRMNVASRRHTIRLRFRARVLLNRNSQGLHDNDISNREAIMRPFVKTWDICTFSCLASFLLAAVVPAEEKKEPPDKTRAQATSEIQK